MAAILRKYGEEATFDFTIFEVDGVNFRVDAVHAAGDTSIMKDEGAQANTTNSFTDEGDGYSFILTATEMQAARIVIYIIDQTATKVWLDTRVVIETYGNASAQHAFDLGTASTPQTGDNFARLGAPAGASVSADNAAIKSDTAATLTDTAEIGVAGAGLTNINLPNQTMDITGSLSGSVGSVTADVGITQAGADKAWGTPTRVLTAATNITTDDALIDNDGIASNGVAIAALNDFDPATDAVANVTLVATTTLNTDMRGTNSALLAADINLTAGAIDNVTLVATTTTNTDMRGTDGANTTTPDNAGITANGVAIAALNDLSASQVNTEVLDVLTVDTFAEPSSVPAATSSILDKLNWLFSLGRNKFTQTSTTQTIRNDADSADIGSSSVSDDGTTFTRDEWS